ncbi:TetR/AcrR family transcriptional regulator [Streptococcus dentasini]
MTKDNRKKRTRKALEQAMVQLLGSHNFDEITTSQLAKTAGISRSSFYTHYKDKYDMIDRYQQAIFNKLEYVFDKHHRDIESTLLEVFEFLDRESLFASLITQNGTKEIQNFIRHHLQRLISSDFYDNAPSPERSSIERLYNSVYLSHAMFGVYQIWVVRGKKESPKQITKLLMKLLPDSN